MKMLRTYMMIDTNDTAFQERPETFNRIGMNAVANIFFSAMIDNFMLILGRKIIVSRPFIGHKGSIGRNVLTNNSFKSFAIDFFNRLRNNPTLTLSNTKDGSFILRTASAFTTMLFSTNIGFISFNDTIQRLLKGISTHSQTDSMKHVPSRLLSYFNVFSQLIRRDSFFVRRKDKESIEPFLKRERRVFKDSTDLDRERFPAIGAFKKSTILNPVEFFKATTMRTNGLTVPPHLLKKLPTRLFIGEAFNHVKKAIEFCFGFHSGISFLHPLPTYNN